MCRPAIAPLAVDVHGMGEKIVRLHSLGELNFFLFVWLMQQALRNRVQVRIGVVQSAIFEICVRKYGLVLEWEHVSSLEW